MSDFTSIINHKDLFQVQVEFRPIVDVLNFINEELKVIEKRIASLESVSQTHVLLETYESTYKTMDARVTSIEEQIKSITNGISGLSTDVKNIESKANLTIDERMNDILVSTNMNIKHAVSTTDAQFRQNNEAINSIKQEISDLISFKDESNLDSLRENVKRNTGEIRSLKKKITELEEANENGTTGYNNANNNAEQKKNDNDPKMDSLLKQVDQQKEEIRTLTNAVNEIKERLSITEENMFNQDDEHISIKSSLPSSAQLKNNEDLTHLNESLLEFKNEFDDHQSKVVSAMKAIQFELQQIRDNGQGLLELPPLNLYNVVPSFFNEDKKFLSDSETAPVLELAEKDTEEEEEEKKKEIDPRQKIQNEIGRMQNTNIESILRNSNKKSKKSNSHSVVIKTDDIPPPVSTTTERIIQVPAPAPHIDINKIIWQVKDDPYFLDIKDSFNQFRKDQNGIMNAIDRKVDREYVERLFDKFRTIVHGLNERVKELASLTDDYATKEELKLIVQLVKNLPRDSKPGTAVKRGPTCLFCGRPKSSIAGEISPRTAAMAGSPPVQNVGTKDGDTNCEFVYGDGQAYYKRDENFQSFPHFDILPPLPATESSPEKNGRGSMTRNGERAKTSMSMPNTRASKSRK